VGLAINTTGGVYYAYLKSQSHDGGAAKDLERGSAPSNGGGESAAPALTK